MTAARPASTSKLPAGVRLLDLQMNADDRGCFTELFRREWETGIDPIQWNVVTSEADVLRGVHVHRRHDDYLILVQGRAVIGLKDLREEAGAEGGITVRLDASKLQAIVIPHGVAHGFYFLEPSMHVYSVSDYWDPNDELGCHWSDPGLGLAFPCTQPKLSARDASLPPLAELMRELNGGA